MSFETIDKNLLLLLFRFVTYIMSTTFQNSESCLHIINRSTTRVVTKGEKLLFYKVQVM